MVTTNHSWLVSLRIEFTESLNKAVTLCQVFEKEPLNC